MTLFALLVLRFVRASRIVFNSELLIPKSELNKRYNSLLEFFRDSFVKYFADVPFGILHREMAQDDFFALDFIVKLVERMHNIFQVAVPLLFAHRFFAVVKECAFRNQHLRLEHAAVVEQAFAKAIAHKAHERFVNFTRDFDAVLAELYYLCSCFPEKFIFEFFLVKVNSAAHCRDGMLDLECFESKVLAVS